MLLLPSASNDRRLFVLIFCIIFFSINLAIILVLATFFTPCIHIDRFVPIVIAAMSSFFCELMPRIGCLLAAIAMHRILLFGSLRAPLHFFDTTPTGRILARFSKDIDVLDTTLPGQLGDMIWCGFEVIFVEAPRHRRV